MVRVWTVYIVALINLALVALAINPWFLQWSGQALAVLALETALLLVIGLPAVLYQMLVRKKSLKQSLRDALEVVMDLLSGAA